jgi:hypothetical protein
MSRLDLIVPGVQKGGTTSLFAWLAEHPAFQAPRRKELHLFDDETLDWDVPPDAALEAWFDGPADGRLRFDVTPVYVFWPNAMERIARYAPEVRLICLFRDPIERAWSQWCMLHDRQQEPLSFSQAIREGRRRLPPDQPSAYVWREYSYVERGFYAPQVRRLQALFRPEQLLLLRSEDLADDHAATLAWIARFLGVGAFPEGPPKREHTRHTRYAGLAMAPEDRRLLAELYAPDLDVFARLTGLDVAHWAQP